MKPLAPRRLVALAIGCIAVAIAAFVGADPDTAGGFVRGLLLPAALVGVAIAIGDGTPARAPKGTPALDVLSARTHRELVYLAESPYSGSSTAATAQRVIDELTAARILRRGVS